MKILLSGCNGQLAKSLLSVKGGSCRILAKSSIELDITVYSNIEKVVLEYKPDIIINAAAYTAVDKAESEPENAAAVNCIGPENLAIAAKEVGARLIHVSTDYVFDGSGNVPYLETDSVNPLGVYGQTKLAGELLVRSILPDAIILRTAWVFSEYGNNFLKTMLRLGAERNELGIVSDQIVCPTYAGDIASASYNLIDKNAPGGIYHYCGDQEVSWAGFAEAIFDYANQSGKLASKPKVNHIDTSSYPTPAKRPAYSVLSTKKIERYYPASDWKIALQKVIDSL